MAKKKFKTKKIEPRNTNEGKHKTHFYYSFLTIVLLLCLAQISFSAIMNISKIIKDTLEYMEIQPNKKQ